VKRLLPLVLVMTAFTVVGCKPNKPPASQPGMTSEAPPPTPQPYTPPTDTINNPPSPVADNSPMQANPGTEAPVTHHTTHHHAMTSTAHHGKYVVKKGDTLSKIAHAHHVSLKRIEAANPKVDPNKIHVGQTIMIP
jgi:LysM repeat protein